MSTIVTLPLIIIIINNNNDILLSLFLLLQLLLLLLILLLFLLLWRNANGTEIERKRKAENSMVSSVPAEA